MLPVSCSQAEQTVRTKCDVGTAQQPSANTAVPLSNPNLYPIYSCFVLCVVSHTIVAEVWSSNDDGSKAPVPLQAEDPFKTVAYLCEVQLTLSVRLTVSLLLCIGLPFLPFWGVASNLLSRQEVQQLFQSLWSCRRVMSLHSTTAISLVPDCLNGTFQTHCSIGTCKVP